MAKNRHLTNVLHVVVRLRHDCAFSRISAKHPTVPFTHWCNRRVEVLEMHATDAMRASALRKDLATLEPLGFAPVEMGQDHAHLVMTCGHSVEDSVEDKIEKLGCLVLQPIHYDAGWEQYRIIVFDDGRVQELFDTLQALGEVEIVRKKRTDGPFLDGGMLISSGDIVGDLTPRQGKALSQAVAAGYYQVPRGARFQDIAERAGLPRTTFEEHVRKAEAKVIRAVAPYLGTVAAQAAAKKRKQSSS